MYASRLARPLSVSPLGFMEGGSILFVYVAYLFLNYFIVRLFRVGLEITGFSFFFLAVWALFSVSCLSFSPSSVDFYYKAQFSPLSHIFGGHLRLGHGVKEGLGAILLVVLYL